MSSFSSFVRHPLFRAGISETASLNIGLGAWGLVTGVAMVQSGLSIPVALITSLTVYAGSAQLAALPLIASGTPAWLIWATAICVNLRFVIFSAAWRPFMIGLPWWKRLVRGYFASDALYVFFLRRFEEPRDDEGQSEYFWGAVTTNWLGWQIPAVIGILLADVIPVQWGLGFAGVLALLALLASLIDDKTCLLAAVVAGTAAVAAFTLPLRLHILVAIAAAVAVALLTERHLGGATRKAST